MPNSFLVLPKISSKSFKLTTLLLLSPLFFWGQTLTGLWIGALTNDVTTIRRDQSFEIVLTESNGKVFGFSRNEFIVDDTLYYVLKKVSGTINGDICEVVDDEIVSYNFPGKLDKGIKVTSTFSRNKKDSTWNLDGTWKTNATKKYYSVTGKVNLTEEKDLTASKIFPHLEELNLANSVAFYKERKDGVPLVKMVKPEKIKTEYSTKTALLKEANKVTVSHATPDLEKAEIIPPVVAVSKPLIELPKTDTKKIATGRVDIIPDASTKTIAQNKIPEQEVVAVTNPLLELPKTDTKTIPATAVNISPDASTKTIAQNKIPEQEVVAVINPLLELPKTDTKTIPVTSVNISPDATTKTIAQNNIAQQEIVAVTNPLLELPKTDTKTIPVTAVNISPEQTTKTIAQNKIPDVANTAEKKPSDIIVENGSTEKVINTAPIAKNAIKKETDPEAINTKPLNATFPETENKIAKTTTVVKQESVIQKQPENNSPNKQVDTKSVAKTNSSVTSAPNKPTSESTTQTTSSTNPVATNNTQSEKKEIKTEPVASVIPQEKKPLADVISQYALVGGRKTEFSQIVSFSADSLEFSLYDNGEIDGDTVSVFMNGEVILSKQGLKASAIKKTIHITRANEDFTLVLFAENVGKYPPNTGLLVVHDGEDIYNLRFSSDLSKNTGIVFRKKR